LLSATATAFLAAATTTLTRFFLRTVRTPPCSPLPGLLAPAAAVAAPSMLPLSSTIL
jgi:hypothetical protein